MSQRVTIADVARLARVSTMTVSRVINHKGEVAAGTRARVERAIAQLDYRPSQAARSLTTRRTHTLGLLVPDITNPFYPAIVRGAEDVAWDEGYAVTLTNTVEDPARERAAFAHFDAHRVDGLVVCSSRLPDGELIALLRRHPAAVLVNRRPDGLARTSTLVVDDALGARVAVTHLATRGRRTLGLLAGPARSTSSWRRREGARDALVALGLEQGPGLIEEGEPTEDGGRAAMAALLGRRPDLDGVFAYNDVVALGALEALAAAGRRVPEDVAVVGCDDVRLARLATPALTTLRTDTYALGRRAAQLLFELLRGDPPRHVQVTPELVVRASAP